MPRGRRAVLAAGLLAASACGKPAGQPASSAPDFQVETVGGETLRLSALKGKVVLLDFWATWCLPCEETIPKLAVLHQRYRERGLEVVGVSVDDDVRDVPPYAKSHGIGYAVALDPDKDVMDAYGVRSIPTTILVDRSGRLRGRWLGTGARLERELEAEVQKLLVEN
ncbi:MAG: TlpA family protein disulfide reductase [Elusimicrobia bacterium]|nr:TlpA family protein disulfide reductase [Elusimicrobiota bacterium]